MNPFGSRSLLAGVIGAVICFASLPQTRADDKDFDQAQQATKDFDQAQADAEKNMPSPDVRNAENNLDEKERKLDDAKSEDKDQAKADRDSAKADADQARENTDARGDFTKQYDAYRDALKKRRDACKKLKELIPKMEKQIETERSGRKGLVSDDVLNAHKSTLQKARNAVKKCGQPPSFAMVMPGAPGGGQTVAMLAAAGKVKIDSAGTGETIGHIADLKIQNLTDQLLTCVVPPMILESGSGKNQHYACPKGQNVALNPHQEKTVPMDGVCVNRSKPPVGKGVTGDLVVNEGNPTIPQNPNSHMPAKNANKLLRLCTSKYDAADKLQRDGTLKDLPYKDKQKQKDIVTQWSIWCDPRISEPTGAPPATKEDLKKVVYKQVPEPMTPETKKKIDKVIETIFEKVELTTATAKDLEKPDQFANVALTDEEGKDESKPPATATSPNAPTTQEKPAQTPTPKAQPPQKPPALALGSGPLAGGPVPVDEADRDEVRQYRNEVLRTQERLKQATLDRDKKKEAAIRKDPRIAPIERTIERSKKALASKTTAKEDKELHSQLINDKEKQLTGIRADDEQAWNLTPEGRKANKDVDAALGEANKAQKDNEHYREIKGLKKDVPELIKDLPQEKADESNQKRQEEDRKR